jgi:hypothetical protein
MAQRRQTSSLCLKPKRSLTEKGKTRHPTTLTLTITLILTLAIRTKDDGDTQVYTGDDGATQVYADDAATYMCDDAATQVYADDAGTYDDEATQVYADDVAAHDDEAPEGLMEGAGGIEEETTAQATEAVLSAASPPEWSKLEPASRKRKEAPVGAEQDVAGRPVSELKRPVLEQSPSPAGSCIAEKTTGEATMSAASRALDGAPDANEDLAARESAHATSSTVTRPASSGAGPSAQAFALPALSEGGARNSGDAITQAMEEGQHLLTQLQGLLDGSPLLSSQVPI